MYILEKNKDKILVLLYSSKTHNQGSYLQEIKISAESLNNSPAHGNPRCATRSGRNFCPFKLTRQYMELQGGFTSDDENFFLCSDGSPVVPMQARNTLRSLLNRVHLNSSLYCFHSFRSSRSSDLLKFGYSVDQIKKIGRWKSNAVYRYLK